MVVVVVGVEKRKKLVSNSRHKGEAATEELVGTSLSLRV
jgi:hypothetical protein